MCFKRLKTIKNNYNIMFISLQEPFEQAEYLPNYMRVLDMQGWYANSNNKIWLIWSNDFTVSVIKHTDQHVNCRINHSSTSKEFHVTCVYAKYRTALMKELWEELVLLSNSLTGLWSIIGSFNVILEAIEKEGGTPYRIDKSFDFINCMEDFGL